MTDYFAFPPIKLLGYSLIFFLSFLFTERRCAENVNVHVLAFQENQSPVKTIPENAVTSSSDTTNSDSNKHSHGSVEKLASALNNKVTIKVNPENGSR